MPVLGLGTWPMDNEATAVAVTSAVHAGYRLFDTAESYGNETGLGEGLRRTGIAREEVFITSKFSEQWHSIDGVRHAFESSIKRLGVDYLDMFLVHWPAPGRDRYVEALEGLHALLETGRVRSIGTSNFKPSHLQRLFSAGLMPHFNQIQLDPEHARPKVIAFHAQHNVITGSYSPLGRGGTFLRDQAVTEAAAKHSRTPSQIVLRWVTQRGIAAVAKSSDPRRQQENIDIFDFILDNEEMAAISMLDTDGPPRLDADEYSH